MLHCDLFGGLVVFSFTKNYMERVLRARHCPQHGERGGELERHSS